ncbi:3-glucan synthase mok14 [Durusdinium trenchii]|uniref:3-glucan synthase mok14 n=1 Tax=Durusdinium trenchii TaxID=1381693 RepID=A0ABP0QNZ8_9DINO
MLERGFWSSHESMATSADFAADIWISYLCTPEPPPCPPPAEGEDGWQCHSYRKGENLDWCASVGTVGCVSYALQNFSSEMTSCGQCDCCWRPVIQIPTAEPQTCCILFNDLLLNYTITPDLSRCRAAEVQLAPSWVLTSSSIYEGQTPGRCEDSSAAGSEQEVREVVEDEHDVACASTENDSWITVVATVGWAFLWVVLLLCHSWSRLYLSVVREASPERCRPQARNESHVVVPEEPKRHVLLASIEHHVPERHINAFTGETGAFLQDFIQEHPAGSLSLVHPMLNMDYGHLEPRLFGRHGPVTDVTSGDGAVTVLKHWKIQTVEVFFLDSQDPIEHDVRWYFLRHELFSDRTQESLFPQPMSKIRALRFYSLWNQALAMLLEALKPDVYHCLDSHQALAPLYMEKQIPMVLLLRDPWTMVSVDSDFIGDRFWKTVSQMRRMSLVFNLKIHTIRRYCLFEGRFNLMSAGVRYISDARREAGSGTESTTATAEETQRGRGLCVLSVPTARQLRREHRLLQAQATDGAEVLDLDALKRQKVRDAQDVFSWNEGDLRGDRRTTGTTGDDQDQARRALQQHAGLAEADAKVLLFVGPWAHHAGRKESRGRARPQDELIEKLEEDPDQELLKVPEVRVAFQPFCHSYSDELLQAAEEASEPELQEILRKFQDPNVCDDTGETALMKVVNATALVVRPGDITGDIMACLELLLSARAEVNQCCKEGRSALHLAASMSLAKIVKLLLRSGADANLKAMDGTCAIHLAAQYGSLEVVQLLDASSSEDPLSAVQKVRNSPLF